MKLLNTTFNPTYWNCDSDNPSYDPFQLDMFDNYTVAIVLARDELDEDWFSDYSSTVYIGTNRWEVEDKFTHTLQSHDTNVGRFLLVDKPLYKLYNKETT